ncbi:MAG: 30S ribosomal protein S18 [Acidimicrobiaceae bacterium]|nr:30S ribosomal protein S18 [Acidimicrobiaceae bacterium]
MRKPKKRSNVVVTEKIGFVDYKDVNLLQRFMSDRSKLRARRMNGNSVQLQRDIATAVKNAREMALLPYTKRVSATRAPRERGEYGSDDRDRDRGPRRPRRDDSSSGGSSSRASAPAAQTVEVSPNITAEISTDASTQGATS